MNATYARDEAGQLYYLPHLYAELGIDTAGKTDEQLIDEVNEATRPMREWWAETRENLGRMVDAILAETPDDLRKRQHPLVRP